MNLVIDLLLAVYIVVSLLLVLVVLMQRPRSEGLGTAFASGMVEQYIGPATSVLVRFTTWMAGTFFVLSIVLTILYSHRTATRSQIGERLRSLPAVKGAATAKAVSPNAPLTRPALPVVAPSPAAALAPAPAPMPGTAPAALTAPAAPAPAAPVATPNPVPVAAPLAPPPAIPPASPAAH